MRCVKLISQQQMLRISHRVQNAFDKSFQSDFKLIEQNTVYSQEVYDLGGSIVEVYDLESNCPTLTGLTGLTGDTLHFVRPALIEREVFKEEYPEYFL